MKYPIAILTLLALVLPASAQDDVRLMAPGSARASLAVLLPAYEAKTHQKVTVTFTNAIETRKQAVTHDDYDVMIVQPPLPDLLAAGHMVAASQTALVEAPVAIVVKTGTPHPDLSSPDSIKKALLAAKSIAYPDPAGVQPIGPSFVDTITKLGIAKEVEAKAKLTNGGPQVLDFLLKGDVELGVDFLSESKKDGIDIVGTLPASISVPPRLYGFVTTKARDAAKAQALLQYLTSADAAPVYRAQGLVPASK